MGIERVVESERFGIQRRWDDQLVSFFTRITASKIQKGHCYDIPREDGSFSFWHVTVEEEPLSVGDWLQFRVTDGLYAERIGPDARLIREVF